MPLHEARPHLVGRDSETGRVARLIDQVREHGGALVVRGPAGIGKSALLRWSASVAAERGLKVLAGSGVRSEARLPFAGLHQILHPLLPRAAALARPQQEALLAAFGATQVAAPDLYLVALATLNLLSDAAADRPVVLVVDDAHWLDESSAQVLLFVARRIESEPVVMLAGVRDGLTGTGLPELPLAALEPEAAEGLLQRSAPGLGAKTSARVLREAAGNPLALIELPKAWHDLDGDALLDTSWLPLTTRLEHAFGSQVAMLPAGTRALLLIAAVNDGDSLDETLTAAEAADERDLAPAAGLLTAHDGRVAFRHPLLRSAIYQAAGRTERQGAHAAVARALTGVAGAEDRLLWHLAAASSRPDAGLAAALAEMAWRARQRGAPNTAVSALERSARLSADPQIRADRLLGAADIAVELGNRDVVARLLRQTEPLDLTPAQRTQVLWIRASFGDGTDDTAVGAAGLADLAATAAEEGHPDLAARILWGAALRCHWVVPGVEAARRVVRVAESLPLDRHDPRLLAILAYAAPVERGSAVIAGLVEVTSRPVVDPADARFLGTAAVLVGALDLAESLSTTALSGLRAQGRLQVLARARCAQAWSAALLADLDVGLPAAREAEELAIETGQPQMRGTALCALAVLEALRGERDRALAVAAEAERESLAAGVRPVLATVQLARGLVCLAEGQYAEAYGHLARMHDPADPSFHPSIRCHAVGLLADAAVRGGDVKDAQGIVAEMEELALVTSSPALHSGLRLARALLSAVPEPLFRDALAAEPPFARAQVQLAFGSWLRRRRRAVEARALLRSARDAFDALGAVAWGDRARRELRASGEKIEQRSPAARDVLTAQELQIVQLAARGLTNREIGERLYLSHRTVGAHLYRIFPKLGITSRTELQSSD
ncbi:AAA family ATPase [Streptosporangium sp. NPDC051023]|uniref:ATP-binding protein n=1 Tax=Streptosporangium sp. NPDC051023 TaxID=3155410 RepID=UPI00344CA6F3